MTTLTYGAVSITLPDDMLWTDEYIWLGVEQRREYSLTGALVVESAAKITGRSITLGGDDGAGWVVRSVIDALRIAASVPGRVFTLTLNGTARLVMFDHEAGPINARPVLDVADPIAGDFYVVGLKFFEV